MPGMRADEPRCCLGQVDLGGYLTKEARREPT